MTKTNFSLKKKTSIRLDSWDFRNISRVLYSNCLQALCRRDHISESHRMCFIFWSQTEVEIEYGCEFEQLKIGKPGVLQSVGSQRVRQDLVTEQHHCLFLSIGPATLGILFIGGLIPALRSWCLRKSHVSLVEEALGFSVGCKKPVWECSDDFQLLTLAWFVCKSVKYWLTDLNDANWVLVLIDVLCAACLCIWFPSFFLRFSSMWSASPDPILWPCIQCW